MTHLLREKRQNLSENIHFVTSGFPSKSQQGQTASVTPEEELHSLCRGALSFYEPFTDVIKIPALLTTEQRGNFVFKYQQCSLISLKTL